MNRVWSALLIAAALAVAGCGVSTPSENTHDTITGSLGPAGVSDHTYSFSHRGESFLTISSVTPQISGSLYVGIGIPNATACSMFQQSIQAIIVNREISFGVLDTATYCVEIFDPGTLTRTVTYTGTFSYP